MTPQVCLLEVEDVAKYWDYIEWRIDDTPSLLRFFTKEDLIDQIGKKEIQVWSAGRDLVLLTMVVNSPLGKILQVLWAHGTGIDCHWDELKEKFHMFGWMAGCKKIEVLGRPGWEKRFKKEEGFKVEYVAYTADIQKPRMN